MPTNRTPRKHRQHRKITAAAIEIFKRLRPLPCDTDDWWQVYDKLHDELNLEPWLWPGVKPPHVERYTYEDRERHHAAQDLWRVLAAAARSASF
jgi:hypothetical protein